MVIFKGVTQGPFYNGRHLHALLKELLSAANVGRNLVYNKKLRDHVDADLAASIAIEEESLVEWLMIVLPSSSGVLLRAPNGNTRTDWMLKGCLKDLPEDLQIYLGELLDKIVRSPDQLGGNRGFFVEKLVPCYRKFLASKGEGHG